MSSESNNHLPVAAAAAYLGISKSTLDKLRVYGSGPRYAKLGRRVTYRLADLDQWVQSRLRRSTSDKGEQVHG